MPAISRFYGIIIKMYFNDHNPPHIHAIYGEYMSAFRLDTLEMIEGDLPIKAQKLVIEWAAKNKKDLISMWKLQEVENLAPLE